MWSWLIVKHLMLMTKCLYCDIGTLCKNCCLDAYHHLLQSVTKLIGHPTFLTVCNFMYLIFLIYYLLQFSKNVFKFYCVCQYLGLRRRCHFSSLHTTSNSNESSQFPIIEFHIIEFNLK